MSEELSVLKIVTTRLNEARIPYMLTGSLATNYYSIPRMTRDIDIVIEIDTEGVIKLVELFKADFYIDEDMINDVLKYKGMFNIIHNNSVIKVDFIIKKDTEYRKTEFKRRREIEIDGTSMWIASPEDMVISKLYWAKDSYSDLQLRDVKNLMSSVTGIDRKYIKDWVQQLDLNDIFTKALDE